MRKPGCVVAHDDPVTNSRPPPGVFGSGPEGDGPQPHRQAALAEPDLVERLISEPDGLVDGLGQRVERVGVDLSRRLEVLGEGKELEGGVLLIQEVGRQDQGAPSHPESNPCGESGAPSRSCPQSPVVHRDGKVGVPNRPELGRQQHQGPSAPWLPRAVRLGKKNGRRPEKIPGGRGSIQELVQSETIFRLATDAGPRLCPPDLPGGIVRRKQGREDENAVEKPLQRSLRLEHADGAWGNLVANTEHQR